MCYNKAILKNTFHLKGENTLRVKTMIKQKRSKVKQAIFDVSIQVLKIRMEKEKLNIKLSQLLK